MNSKKLMKIVVIILIFIILQSYFTNPESFSTIIEKWKGYFMTLIMAIFIAILLEPIKKYLKKKSKINDVLAISLSIVFVVLIVVIISLIVIPEIISSLKVLNDIYPAISEKVLTIGKDVTNYLAEKNIYTVDTKELDDYFTKFISNNTSNIKEFVLAFIGGLVNWTLGFTNLIVAFTLAFLILLDKKNLMKTLENLIIIIFGVKNTPYVMNKLKLSKDIFISYISGKIIVSFIVGLCVYVILLITGTPYAALSAILLGIGNMIPYVGSILGGIVAFFLILLVAPIKTLILLIAIVIAQLVDGFIVGPKIIGDKVGLSTFWVMVSMIIFGNLFGLVGMFLGTPILSIIRLFYIDLLKAKQGGEQ
ncbi:AI-2E family transporter [Fusobacterium animalis]|uniref:AI-2E family transporter n=1 Tax=Fusobacterium animalis TaxID=76859 RepID=UPI0034DF82E1